ncbi:MAG: protease pro-enzyme activation domain-containing protein, partial [Terriglobales bacterium]
MKSRISILVALALWLSLNANAQLNRMGGLALEGSGSQSRGGAFANVQNLGPEDPSKLITVTVWLNQHNKAALDELVRQMYEPGSPNYHHFLTHEQYRSQFAPSAAEAAQVRDYLTAHSFTVTSVDKFSHYLVAQGRVRDAQNAFNVKLNRVILKGQVHRVTSGAAAIGGGVGKLVHTVQGLDDFAPRPTLARAVDPSTRKPAAPKTFSMADPNASVQNNCLTGSQQVRFTTVGGGPSATYRGNRYATDGTNTCPGYIPAQLQAAYGLTSLYGKGWD